MEKGKKSVKIPAKMTAIAANSSHNTVEKVRAGKRVTGKVAKRIMMADELLEQGTNKLIEEVKRVVNF
jgi:hypothetical protein